MLSDKKKYYLIHLHLKGKLEGAEKVELEEALANDPMLHQEIAMHQMANELVMDHQLLEVRTKVGQTIAHRKSLNYWGKACFGIALLAAVGTTVYTMIPKTEQGQTMATLPTNTVLVPSTSTEMVPNVHATKKTKTFIQQPNLQTTQPNQTTISQLNQTDFNLPPTPPIAPVDSQARLPLNACALSNASADLLPIRSSINSGMEEVKTIAERPWTTMQSEKKVSVVTEELILNPQRNEQVQLPLGDVDFSGMFEVFGSDGQLLVQTAIVSGYPNQWDGTVKGGGQAASGQYGFVLKNNQAEVVKQGYITVVR